MRNSLYILFIFFTVFLYAQEPAPDTSEDLNWISSIGYDLNGQTLSKGVSYFNILGKPTQSQTWDVLTGKVWNSQVLYDYQGRPALQSLSAPKGTIFGYQSNFIRTSSGATYGINNFDTSTTIENPSTVGTQANTLGHYYSTSNASNPYQDVTNYPFSRTIYSSLNPGAVKKVIGGNKIAGQWKQTYSFSMPAGQELSHSNSFASSSYNDDRISKTISRDIHGIEAVVFTNSDGNTLAAARSGNEEGTPLVYNNIVKIEEQGFVDIHIPTGCTGITVSNTGSIPLKIFNLITETPVIDNITGNYTLSPGFYRVAVSNPNTYQYNPSQAIQITHSINYYDYALNYYDKAGRLVKSKQPNGTDPTDALLGTFQSTFSYNSLGQLQETTSPDEGTATFKYRKDGQIRFSQNSKQELAGEFSYTNYDNLGRPVESGVYTNNATLDYASSDSIVDSNDGLIDTYCNEQHFTIYDIEEDKLNDVLTENGLPLSYYTQTFVASNVSSTFTEKPTTNRTWYSYDIYGRVKWLVQLVEGLGVKTIDYTYDPITGQVVKVDYQRHNTQERFVHAYTYNITGQLITASTSIDDTNFTEQAHYEYYETGALKRTEIAENLQGIDYIYNLNGQLKAINHPSLTTSNDPGHDGTNGFASDVFGFNINYFNGDYGRTNAPTPVNATSGNQYNGNISSVDFQTQNIGTPQVNNYAYQYNKNNWLQQATFNNNADYKVSGLTYDPNGNILSLNRKGYTDGTGTNEMDDFTYKYKSQTNQLDYVKDDGDNVDENRYDDLKNQEVELSPATSTTPAVYGNNYQYNTIGQLVNNYQDGIAYTYNASGLVTEIGKFTNSDTQSYTTLSLEDYSNVGFLGDNGWTINQGQAILYSSDLLDLIDPNNPHGSDYMPTCDAVDDIYGERYQINFKRKNTSIPNPYLATKEYRVLKDVYHTLDLDLILIQLQKTDAATYVPMSAGATIEVLEGNTVLASYTIPMSNQSTYCNDRYDAHASLNFTPTGDKITLSIHALNDGNPITINNQFIRAIDQTIELDNIHLQVAKEPVVAFNYDDRGHRISKTTYTNGSVVGTYYVRDASGSVMGIYTKGNSKGADIITLKEIPIYGASRLGIQYNNPSARNENNTVYQLTDHLGNVRAVIAKDVASGLILSSATDYYPFGSPMPARQIVGGEQYRYAFQGQEKDPETGKEAFQLRLWDGRIGRWLTTDPAREFNSPYLGMGNNPISKIDPDGGQTEYEATWNEKTQQYDNTVISPEGGIKYDVVNYKGGTLDGDIEIIINPATKIYEDSVLGYAFSTPDWFESTGTPGEWTIDQDKKTLYTSGLGNATPISEANYLPIPPILKALKGIKVPVVGKIVTKIGIHIASKNLILKQKAAGFIVDKMLKGKDFSYTIVKKQVVKVNKGIKHIRYDLKGPADYLIPTPHKQIYRVHLNPLNGKGRTMVEHKAATWWDLIKVASHKVFN